MINYFDFFSFLILVYFNKIRINAFLRKAIDKAMTSPNHAHMYRDQRERSVFVN